MRLRNKKTGEIIEPSVNAQKAIDIVCDYDSLAELSKDWEDAPECIKPFAEAAKVKHTVDFGFDNNLIDTIKIADIDYYEILPDGTKKTKFTWDEMLEIKEKTHGKWRAPTVPEWFAICAAFGRSEDGTDVDPQVLGETLGLTANENDYGYYGYYWSTAAYNSSTSRGLYFYGSNLDPRNRYGKGFGFAVRCVRIDQ